MIRYRLISILIGAGLDCLIGDPQWMPHPVRLMGALISALDKLWNRKEDSPLVLRIKGFVLAVFVVSAALRITWGLLRVLYGWRLAAGVAAESILCCYALAARNLRDSSMEVYKALTENGGDLLKARRAVSMIVGRDTENLDQKGVIRAAVETVAENTADGVIAPLFFLALGGAVGGMAYKAINTMDSMLGYKNERYQYFGTAAARPDRHGCGERMADLLPRPIRPQEPQFRTVGERCGGGPWSSIGRRRGLRGAGCAQTLHRRPAQGDRSGGHSQSEQAYVRGVRAGTWTGGRSACRGTPSVLSLYWRKIRQ